MKVKVINLNSRPDRLIQVTSELQKLEITEFERFPAYSKPDAYRGNALSHMACLQSGCNLIFEDDVFFDPGAKLVFEKAINQLPADAHILYLGGNIISPIHRYSENLYRCTNAWGSYAIYYTEKGLEWIVQRYDPKADPFIIYDEWLREQSACELQAYMVSPVIAWTRAGYSDVNGQIEDYTPGMREHARKHMQ